MKLSRSKPSSKSSTAPLSIKKARGVFEPSETFEETRALINPNGQTAGKNLEMTARRAISFARLCAEWTTVVGDPVLASCRPPHGGEGHDHIKRLIKEIADPWYRDAWTWHPETWEWMYTYWQTGGHDRNLKRLLDQMPDENRERVLKHLQKVKKR